MEAAALLTMRQVVELQSRIVAVGLDHDQVVRMVADAIPLLLPAASSGVVELAEGDVMVYRAASGPAAKFVGLRIALNGSLSGLCTIKRSPLYAEDTETDERVDRAACRSVGARSIVCAPLFFEGRCVGVIKAFSGEPAAFSEFDVQALSLICAVVASCLQHARAFERLREAARLDRLTDLPNRRAFDDDLRACIAGAAESATPFVLVLFDIDGLKAVNDEFGHGAGDLLLQTFATIVGLNIRKADTCYRIGGDEFALLLPSCTAFSAGTIIAKVTAALAHTEVAKRRIGASYGVAQFEEDDTPEAIAERADQAMYALKRQRSGVGALSS